MHNSSIQNDSAIVKTTASMLTRDGIRLDANIYQPVTPRPYPVLLMRQPYGRSIASTVVYAHPSWYAAQGYLVVIQDVRGRGTSQGDFSLFAHEITDGEDTIHWAANLPGSNGSVGMYGFSYQGMTQLYAAVNRPPALKTLCPAMLAYDLYADWAYEGGAFCLQSNLNWAIQLAAETARLQGDEATYLALFRASRNLPLHDPIPANPNILQQLAQDSFYHDWLAHPKPDDGYWQQFSPAHLLEEVDLPMLHIGGWFDTHLRGTMAFYQAMASQSQYRQQLLVGPWGHLPWGQRVGSMDYGPPAASPVDRWQLRWFDQFLKGMDTGLLDEPTVRLFEMGSNSWRTFPAWPAPHSQTFYATSSGLACLDANDGLLSTTPPTQTGLDVLVHDPWRPVPSLGGHAGIPSGSFDRSALDCRSDVLTYTTPPLETELHLAGDITVQITCKADALSFDLSAVVSEVHPNGNVYNLSQGYLRVNEVRSSYALTLQPTCCRLAKGHALRLSLSAACFPAYALNMGTGQPLAESRLIDARIITLTYQWGGEVGIQVQLPIVPPVD